MSLVQVQIVAPDGKTFEATVNDQVGYEPLLRAVVDGLRLPVRNTENLTEDYELQIVDALKLDNGVTIRINDRMRRAIEKIRLIE